MDKKKILIVDDEENIRIWMKEGLMAEGYEIREARDGFNIGSALLDFVPDLIILDLRMGVTDGFTVLENIQRFYVDEGKQRPKVLIVSGFIDKGNKAQFKDMPADDCLGKPFHFEELKRKLTNLLRD